MKIVSDAMTLSVPDYLYDFSKIEPILIADGDEVDVRYARIFADRLSERGLPLLLSDHYIAALVGFERSLIYRISNSAELFYRTYKIPKATTGFREISEPLPSLKAIQRTLLSHVVSKLDVHKSAHAYRVGYSVKRNARIHARQPYILKMDITDFFGSVRVKSIYDLFYGAGYSSPVSALLAGLCTLGGSLPQGAPTSAGLSNAFMNSFDEKMYAHFVGLGKRYTRYSDDITISGNIVGRDDVLFVREGLREQKLRVNTKKTHVFGPGSAKIVTGVQVNGKARAPASARHLLRQEMHYIRTFGLEAHAKSQEESPNACLNRVRGQASYMLWLDKEDREIRKAVEYMRELSLELDQRP